MTEVATIGDCDEGATCFQDNDLRKVRHTSITSNSSQVLSQVEDGLLGMPLTYPKPEHEEAWSRVWALHLLSQRLRAPLSAVRRSLTNKLPDHRAIKHVLSFVTH